MADSGVPASTSSATDMEDALIPTKLPSDCGMDYVPLATMLASGQLAEADQVRLPAWLDIGIDIDITNYLFDEWHDHSDINSFIYEIFEESVNESVYKQGDK